MELTRQTNDCKREAAGPARSECKPEPKKGPFTGLFEKDWEVFVIRRNEATDKYDWFTLCCEAAGEA